jgi:hypothetical protein
LTKKPLNGIDSFRLLTNTPRRGMAAGQFVKTSFQIAFDVIFSADLQGNPPTFAPRHHQHSIYSTREMAVLATENRGNGGDFDHFLRGEQSWKTALGTQSSMTSSRGVFHGGNLSRS